MNLIQAAKTMSSREIAELTGKEHKNVIRDIRVMLIDLHGAEHLERIVPDQYRNRHSEFVRENADAILAAICGNGSELSHQDHRGFSWVRDSRGYVSGFSLDKTHTMTLISGYNVKLRHRIVTRWQELEAQAAAPAPAQVFQIPSTLPEALRLAAELEEQRAEAVAALAIAAPKAEALDRIATANGSLCLTDAAKELQVRPRDLIAWMSSNKWIYKRAGSASWIAYQDRIQAGLLEHKSHIVVTADGGERIRDQVRVTPKGLTRIAGGMSLDMAA